MINFNKEITIDTQRISEIINNIKNDPMGGWYDLPVNPNLDELRQIKEAAQKINSDSDYLVCIGIGGSYLGHKALIEALRPKSRTKILYAGNSMSKRELDYIFETLGDADFSVNVISKSGSTLEPYTAFEALKQKLVNKYGQEGASARIYATTDANKGKLHDEAVANHYAMFVVPDNIGGRYSVLSAVGLLPVAAAGIDIDELLEGARESYQNLQALDSPAAQYACMRQDLQKKGFDTEVFASFEPATMYFNEWLKQLFGETEGKNHQGLFPASVVYSTDLHSLGQYMQDGRRNLFETIVDYPTDEINSKIVDAVESAHNIGEIPVLRLRISGEYGAKMFGELIYFFELSCAISATLSNIYPFDQPGVETYKAEIKKLLQN